MIVPSSISTIKNFVLKSTPPIAGNYFDTFWRPRGANLSIFVALLSLLKWETNLQLQTTSVELVAAWTLSTRSLLCVTIYLLWKMSLLEGAKLSPLSTAIMVPVMTACTVLCAMVCAILATRGLWQLVLLMVLVYTSPLTLQRRLAIPSHVAWVSTAAVAIIINSSTIRHPTHKQLRRTTMTSTYSKHCASRV